LIFDAPGSRVGAVARELQLQQLLSGAGHRVQIVSTFAALEQAVKTTPPDIVLADSGDIAQLEQSVQHGAAIVSIAVLQTSKNRHPLSIIDDALKIKAKRAASKS
jgi:CheY-like chemotaxis protein